MDEDDGARTQWSSSLCFRVPSEARHPCSHLSLSLGTQKGHFWVMRVQEDHLLVFFTFSRMKTRPLHGSVTTGSFVHEGLCKARTIAHTRTAGKDSLSRKRCPGRLYQLRLNSAEVTNHPQTSVASNAEVLCFTQMTCPSQAGDPGGWRHVFLEHGRAHGRRDLAGMATLSSSGLQAAQTTSPHSSLDTAGHLAAPEFNMARYIIFSQEGMTTCQSLTSVSRKYDHPVRSGRDLNDNMAESSHRPRARHHPCAAPSHPRLWRRRGLELPSVSGLMRKGEVLIPLECGDCGDSIREY